MVRAGEGDSVSFMCMVVGSSPVTINWTRDHLSVGLIQVCTYVCVCVCACVCVCMHRVHVYVHVSWHVCVCVLCVNPLLPLRVQYPFSLSTLPNTRVDWRLSSLLYRCLILVHTCAQQVTLQAWRTRWSIFLSTIKVYNFKFQPIVSLYPPFPLPPPSPLYPTGSHQIDTQYAGSNPGIADTHIEAAFISAAYLHHTTNQNLRLLAGTSLVVGVTLLPTISLALLKLCGRGLGWVRTRGRGGQSPDLSDTSSSESSEGGDMGQYNTED